MGGRRGYWVEMPLFHSSPLSSLILLHLLVSLLFVNFNPFFYLVRWVSLAFTSLPLFVVFLIRFEINHGVQLLRRVSIKEI